MCAVVAVFQSVCHDSENSGRGELQVTTVENGFYRATFCVFVY